LFAVGTYLDSQISVLHLKFHLLSNATSNKHFAGTVRKTLPLEQGQLQRALTITSAGYAEPAVQRLLTFTSTGYAVPASVKTVAESSPDIMIQPMASATQSSATAVFQLPDQPDPAILSGSAFGRIHEA
jgi:hypothetical protein